MPSCKGKNSLPAYYNISKLKCATIKGKIVKLVSMCLD